MKLDVYLFYRYEFEYLAKSLRHSHGLDLKLILTTNGCVRLQQTLLHDEIQSPLRRDRSFEMHHSLCKDPLVIHRLTNNLTVYIYRDRLTLESGPPPPPPKPGVGVFRHSKASASLHKEAVVSLNNRCKWLILHSYQVYSLIYWRKMLSLSTQNVLLKYLLLSFKKAEYLTGFTVIILYALKT